MQCCTLIKKDPQKDPNLELPIRLLYPKGPRYCYGGYFPNL